MFPLYRPVVRFSVTEPGGCGYPAIGSFLLREAGLCCVTLGMGTRSKPTSEPLSPPPPASAATAAAAVLSPPPHGTCRGGISHETQGWEQSGARRSISRREQRAVNGVSVCQ